MDAAEFARSIRGAPRPEDRRTWFAALLRKETRRKVQVVGGSAIEVYLSSAKYVTADVDIVGDRVRIEAVLARWRFRRVTGRSHRAYWSHPDLGLVDVVGTTDKFGLPPRKVPTPYGVALVGAPEPLIVRRLYRSLRERSDGLFAEAVALGRLGGLDWDYLESEARFEGVESLLVRLRAAVQRRG